MRLDAKLEAIAADQHGMLARRQLTERHVSWDAVDAHCRAGRWVVRTPRVVSTTTGVLTVEQRRWLAVLHAGPRSLLGGLTAAAVAGLAGWERDDITVLVDDELSFEPVAGVDFFRSRRPFTLLRAERPGIPRCTVEAAVLLHAGYDATPRAAHALLAATVQQRLATAASLIGWVDRLRPLRRARSFRRTLADVDGGAHSGAELDIARLCRRADLPPPVRQVSRTDRDGRQRWTDCEWILVDGTTLVLEVDGSFHLEVQQWTDDLRRARRLTDRTRLVVRCSAYEVRHEPDQVAADLIALGLQPRTRPPDAA